MIIIEIARQDSFQMTIAQYDDMIQAIPPDAANHALHKSILPRTSRRGGHLFDTLVTGPLNGRVLRDVEVENTPTVMCEDHQNEQHLVSHGWHHEEINGHQVPDLIIQKCLPGWRWCFPSPHAAGRAVTGSR